MGWVVAHIVNPWTKKSVTPAKLLGKHASVGQDGPREEYLEYMRKRDADARPWRLSDDSE